MRPTGWLVRSGAPASRPRCFRCHPGRGEGRHLVEEARGVVDQGEGQRRAAPLAEAQVEIEEGPLAQALQGRPMALSS